MFNNTLTKIFSNADLASYTKSIYTDIQPFTKEVSFEDGFQIDISNRMFCDIDSSITKESYVEIKDQKYKVMAIKKWDDYLEIHLYKCLRQV
jgi:hypothetical protein